MNFHDYFSGLDAGQVKAEYKRLAFLYHPDRNHNEFAKYNKLMQELNAAYHNALKFLDGEFFCGSDGKERKYTYNRQTEEDVINAVAHGVRAGLKVGQVSIVGIFVWVEGVGPEEREHHAALRAGNFRYHAKRRAWYWKPYGRYIYNEKVSLEDLKKYYGAKVVEKEGVNPIV